MSNPTDNKRKGGDRRKVERRAPKRGVTIRHDDEWYMPKRIRNAREVQLKEKPNE